MAMTQQAYIWPNAGTYHALRYPSQKHICSSKDVRRAIGKARRLGFAVRVFVGDGRGGVVLMYAEDTVARKRPTPKRRKSP